MWWSTMGNVRSTTLFNPACINIAATWSFLALHTKLTSLADFSPSVFLLRSPQVWMEMNLI